MSLPMNGVRRHTFLPTSTLFHDPIWSTSTNTSTGHEYDNVQIAMATKRLMKELDAFRREPSKAVSRLEPQSDEDLFHLVATLRGPEGTAYEGMSMSTAS